MSRIFLVFIAILTVQGGHLFASAPLESGGFALAPSPSASPAERAAAYDNARSRVLAAAEKYERTPYLYGGTDRRGLDCSGFVYLSFNEALGITVPRNTGSLYSWVEKIPVERAQPGDLVFFNTAGGGRISHVGIFMGNGRFIHAASEGPVTGVIYSDLDEKYWSRTYAGSGRVLPASTAGPVNQRPSSDGKIIRNLLIGFAVAPSWNTYHTGDTIFRGAVGQFRMGAEIVPFNYSMIVGMEIRSEWDGALGVFRLPFTLSWGMNDNLRLFAGPVISFGDAELAVPGENRRYTGGTSWLGTAGITFSPASFEVAGIELAPYGELAWQSYVNDNASKNFGADFAAGFRFSTGIRWTWRPQTLTGW